MAAKDRLTPKNSGSRAMGASLNVQTPPVKVRMPAINVPEIKIPEIKIPEIKMPQVNVPAVDIRPIAEAINSIGKAVEALGAQQAALAQQHSALLEELKASRPRPRKAPGGYTVDFDRENGETVGMRIKVD